MIIAGRSLTKDRGKQERRIIREIVGPVCIGGLWMKRKADELYQKSEKHRLHTHTQRQVYALRLA